MNLFIEINRNKLKYASGKHIIVINEIPIRLGFHFSNGAEKENAMKSTRRIVAAGLAVATMFGTLGLAGCGSNSGSEQESNPKTIKIWHYEEDNGA